MLVFILAFTAGYAFPAGEKEKSKENKFDTIKSSHVSGLTFRSIGPAFTSGRIADFAVNPKNHSEYYVAVASGHIWKTVNNGTTFDPVFDNYGSYSMGCLAIDPNNPYVIWAGTGENNHQRALGFGDGVYKTVDGGKSWSHMGLKESRQIGKIAIDPRNSNVVFVAAEGSVWGPGGERGLYKTTDGGKTWKCVLQISENTGVNNVLMDPRDPDLMYASSEQRRRHIFTKIGGGPETAIYKSTDGGENWRKLTSGLPGSDMGGVGLDISPVNPDILYAIIEAALGEGGFYRSADRGESWSKMSDHTAQGQYYNEIFCDPVQLDRVYSVETISHVTNDGGRTWRSVGNNRRHVDDHALWIDPDDNRHFMIGSDGGIYETYDQGANFIFKSNLPVTQFYRVSVDNSLPFYWVYGGTQDNNSLGGPSRNLSEDGVTAADWVVTLGGDGFFQAIDPTNPDIVYSEYQYGNIYRYDKKSGEAIDIKPAPAKDENTFRWNWNTPFILSRHSNTRLYIAANKLFRSDDRGNSWKTISGDLTRQMDRNTWPVMGRYWGIDAVAKDVSTSLFGTIVSLDESVVKGGLIYAGTDDGLVQVTEDNGQNWFKADKFPGVPEYTYVSDLLASRHDENVVFAAFDNHQRDDFKPYLLKSEDKGRTWKSISSNLPEKGMVKTIQQDPLDPDLLFAGTEFGVFFSVDGGKIWTQLKSGIPTVAVMDMAIQERESDLVVATFGRGFYILDNYQPLRELTPDLLKEEAHFFPIKDALMFVETGNKYGQGSTVYTAKNPDFGATFTYYVKESPKTLREKRHEKEKELAEKKEPIPIPSMDELRAEEDEVKPHLVFTITDESGNIIRKLTAAAGSGIGRLTWNLRYPSTAPVNPGGKYDPFSTGGNGLYVMPGKYLVSIARYVNGTLTDIIPPTSFQVVPLNNTTLPAENRGELVAYQRKVAELARSAQGAEKLAYSLMDRVHSIRQALLRTPVTDTLLAAEVVSVQKALDEILWAFNGEPPKASFEETRPAPLPINERLGSIIWSHWGSTSEVTQTQKNSYDILTEVLPQLIERLKTLQEVSLKTIEQKLEQAGAPYTPGRIPEIK